MPCLTSTRLGYITKHCKAFEFYQSLKDVIWCKEEPKNIGSWTFAVSRLGRLLSDVRNSLMQVVRHLLLLQPDRKKFIRLSRTDVLWGTWKKALDEFSANKKGVINHSLFNGS